MTAVLDDLSGAEEALFRAGALEGQLRAAREQLHSLRASADSLRREVLEADHPGRLRQLWKQTCEVVYSGRAEEAHARRPQVERELRHSLLLLTRVCRQLEECERLGAGAPPGDIRKQLAELERFEARVLAPWKTVEDLEDLAAQDFPLSGAQLEAVAKRHPAPAEWLRQDEPRPW